MHFPLVRYMDILGFKMKPSASLAKATFHREGLVVSACYKMHPFKIVLELGGSEIEFTPHSFYSLMGDTSEGPHLLASMIARLVFAKTGDVEIVSKTIDSLSESLEQYTSCQKPKYSV